MMFIVRTIGEPPASPDIQIKLSRPTPAIAADVAGKTDFFCSGDAEAMASLRDTGAIIVELHDGYYEDGKGGGVGIWGQGRYWEIRSEPLTVVEACGPGGQSQAAPKEGEHVEVRRAIFGV